MLLREEMCRVGKSLHKAAEKWDHLQTTYSADDERLTQGLRAYALRQADMYRSIQDRFKRIWEGKKDDEGDSGDEEDDGVSDTEPEFDRVADLW